MIYRSTEGAVNANEKPDGVRSGRPKGYDDSQ